MTLCEHADGTTADIQTTHHALVKKAFPLSNWPEILWYTRRFVLSCYVCPSLAPQKLVFHCFCPKNEVRLVGAYSFIQTFLTQIGPFCCQGVSSDPSPQLYCSQFLKVHLNMECVNWPLGACCSVSLASVKLPAVFVFLLPAILYLLFSFSCLPAFVSFTSGIVQHSPFMPHVPP